MQINSITIHNSSVTFAETIGSIGNTRLGIDDTDLIKLVEIVKEKEVDIRGDIQANFTQMDIASPSIEKQEKFITIFKKFGFDFATKLTSSGFIEILKYFLISHH